MKEGMFQLIGIAGKKESGKNTLAKILAAMSDEQWAELSFAVPLKTITTYLFGKDAADKTKSRETLCEFGTAARKICPDVWIHQLVPTLVNSLATGYRRFLVTDVRYENEARFIKDIGGAIIIVDRDEDPDPTHISEWDMDTWRNEIDHLWLENNSGKTRIAAFVEDAMAEIDMNSMVKISDLFKNEIAVEALRIKGVMAFDSNEPSTIAAMFEEMDELDMGAYM